MGRARTVKVRTPPKKRKVLASRKDIEEFLEEFKNLAGENGKHAFIVPRTEANKSFASLGITEDTAKSILANLSVGNYTDGPKEDKDETREGDVWFFCEVANGKNAYIKVKIDTFKSGNKFAKCISFHPFDGTPIFPYRSK